MGRHSLGQVYSGLLGEGTCSSGTEARVTRKGGSAEEGMELGVSQLGSKYLQCAGSCRWPGVYAERQGREVKPASSCDPAGVSLGSLPLGTCSEMIPVRFRHFSNCFFYPGSPQGVCHFLSLRAGTHLPNAHWVLPEPSPLIFKILAFRTCLL